jgi:hypothetical protein
MDGIPLDNTDWMAGLAMSTALFAIYSEKKTGNIVWRTDDQGGKRFSLSGLKSFMLSPLSKSAMWRTELLDQNYLVTTGVTTPILATLSKMVRRVW